jgi:hypothetical protein
MSSVLRYRSSVLDPDPHGSTLNLALLDPDPYWKCGPGSRSKEIDKTKIIFPAFHKGFCTYVGTVCFMNYELQYYLRYLKYRYIIL